MIDGRANSGTARVASELIIELSKRDDVHQTLIHFNKSSESVYRIKKIDEIIIPLSNFPIMRHFLSFVFYWARIILFNRNFKKFDLVFWHASRVYPFFFLVPSRRVFINLHDANARIISENTFWTQIFYWNLRLSVRMIDVIFGVSKDACDKFLPKKTRLHLYKFRLCAVLICFDNIELLLHNLSFLRRFYPL